MYLKDISSDDIKKELGISNSQLYDTIYKTGVPTRDGHRVKTQQRITAEEEAIHLYMHADIHICEIEPKTGIVNRT